MDHPLRAAFGKNEADNEDKFSWFGNFFVQNDIKIRSRKNFTVKLEHNSGLFCLFLTLT